MKERKSGGSTTQTSSTTNGGKGVGSPRAASYSEDLRIDLRTAIQRDGAHVVMFGPTGVGKTTLAYRFAKEDFVTPETSTGALYFNRSVKVKDRLIRLRLIDFAGGEKYWCLAPLYYNQAHVLVFVYDITQPATFEVVKDMIREYRVRSLATPSGGGSSNMGTSNATILALVGTKLDLASQRKVSVEEARMLGIKESMEICLEASSRTGEGVEELFQEIATLIMFLT